MTATHSIDTGRLSLALTDLRLRAIKLVWPDLAALAEHEMAERANRRIQRHLEEARLPPDKTIDSFDCDAVPMVSKAQVMALAAGDGWLKKGANILAFGPLCTGKSHLAAALGYALIDSGYRVQFARASAPCCPPASLVGACADRRRGRAARRPPGPRAAVPNPAR